MNHNEHQAAFEKGMSGRDEGHKIEYNTGDRNENPPHPQSSDQDSLHQGSIPGNMPTIEKNPAKNFYANSRNT